MDNPLISDDPRYKDLYDVEAEAAELGNSVDIDVNEALSALRNRAPVLEGSVRELLGLTGVHTRFDYDCPSYSILNFELCDKVFRDNETFTSGAYDFTGAPLFLGRQILTMTGEEHHRLRATSQLMFLRPKATNWWNENWIKGAVDALLGRLETLERPELNMDLCARLPVYVVTVSLGIAGEDALNFRHHMISAMREGEMDQDQRIHHFSEMHRMLSETLEARKAQRQDDVISGLLDADFKELDGTTRKLTDDEIFGYCRLLLLAGGGTTWRQLGITLYGLLTHYHFWEACRDDRKLVDAAIEEAARWNATDPIFPRLTSREVEIGGVTIPANAFVEVCLGAANHDPARWDNPDQFDIMRPFRQHLAFGIGPHHCLGQYVARQEMRTAINALLDRFPNMRLDPDAPAPRLTGGLEQRGMSALHVLLR